MFKPNSHKILKLAKNPVVVERERERENKYQSFRLKHTICTTTGKTKIECAYLSKHLTAQNAQAYTTKYIFRLGKNTVSQRQQNGKTGKNKTLSFSRGIFFGKF